MAKIAPNRPCPCGRGPEKYKRCCGRLHRGASASDPEMLMRSRYVAYVGGLVDFLIETTDPEGPMWKHNRPVWRDELEAYTDVTEFLGLEVFDTGIDLAGGFVHFRVRYEQHGRVSHFTERSRFSHRDGAWRYHSGDVITGRPVEGA